MYSITVADALVGSRYVSGTRNFEGVIVEADKVDYSDQYKIRIRDDFYPRYFWATIEVVA